MRVRLLAALTLGLSFATGCLDTSTPFDMDVAWHTADGTALRDDATGHIEYDGNDIRASAKPGHVPITGEAPNGTMEICIQAQALETVYSDNNISCPGECSSQEYVALTTRQCQTVALDATDVVFELASK